MYENESQALLQFDGGEEVNNARMARQPNLQERMALSIKKAEERLARTKEAKEILDKNPDLERLLNIMQQGIF